MKTLNNIQPGQSCKVISIDEMGAVKRRIIDMGITPGVMIKVVKVAPLGDPIEITLRGYQLSLRKLEAAKITVNSD